MRAWAPGCFHSLSEGADRVGGQLRGDEECPFSGVTKSGRVWRKVPESDARSLDEDAGKRCSECECGHYCKAKDSFRRGTSLVALVRC